MAKKRSLKEYAALSLRGFCMGVADVVPGVSGGTMAFILGIYEELVDSIKSLTDRSALQVLFKGKLHSYAQKTNLLFLIALAFGIAVAVLSSAKLIEHMLEAQPLWVWSFFFGLVLASMHVVAKRIRKWDISLLILLVLGALFAFVLVGIVPVETSNAPWFLILCGAIAICAMILPGISGAFLLVLLGKYAFILNAVNTRDILQVLYVGIGAVIGLLLFSRFLSWLLHHYHNQTVAFLTGLMLGSLRKIWPWKLSADIHEPINIIPPLIINGSINRSLIIGIVLIGTGCIVVILFEFFANKKKKK